MANDLQDAALLAWEAQQDMAITGDPLWRLQCYREALFVLDLARRDVQAAKRPTHQGAAAQLLTAVGSIAANIGESYGRATNAYRARLLSYALGSVREAIAWYQAIRSPIAHALVFDRLTRLARIRRMLLGLLKRLRRTDGKRVDSW
jgi:four helix bundle protein